MKGMETLASDVADKNAQKVLHTSHRPPHDMRWIGGPSMQRHKKLPHSMQQQVPQHATAYHSIPHSMQQQVPDTHT